MTIAFEVRDANSAVQKADYSLDGDRWQTIYPKDGIADSRFEQFELVLDGDAGARGVILRATDALNNVASARGEAPARSRAQAVVDVSRRSERLSGASSIDSTGGIAIHRRDGAGGTRIAPAAQASAPSSSQSATPC